MARYTLSKSVVTELGVANQLAYFRSKQDHFMGPSFKTIAAYKENSATPLKPFPHVPSDVFKTIDFANMNNRAG